MRKLVMAAILVFGTVQGTQAADLPILRGALSDSYGPRVVNWQGYYIGGQAGYGSADMDFSRSNSGQIARLLDNTVIESGMSVSQWPIGIGKESIRHEAFGGFIGYNGQWDDVVLGVEGSFMHGRFYGMQSASVGRISSAPLSDGNFHAVTATTLASQEITDMGSLRLRAGYATGSFLPYMFGGVALANANIVRAVTVTDAWAATQAGAVAPGAMSATLSADITQHNHLLVGYSAGVGVDVALMAGLFMRAEWEYARFTGAVDTSVNTVRAGLGYKF
ncbi:MAG: porin family protein [Xanthobacteraceae bacterium]|nr:porin family protein [Xanthobacteraceae bacterium]